MPSKSSIERSIPSTSVAGKNLINDVLAELTALNWDEQELFGVHLAVEEAVVNAIKHGNRNDREKQVHVLLKPNAKEFWIEITDEGDGFDPNDVPDPTDDEHLELPSGRGLMLMRNFMTSVEFNQKGNSVVMEKRLD